MTPDEVIRYSLADGVALTLSPAGTIKAVGAAAAVNRWAGALREHKAGIVEMLRTAAPADSGDTPDDAFSRQWVVSFPDRDDLPVLYAGGASFGTVMADYPTACAAQPVADETGQRCLTCKHFRRPGLSAGYCGGRGDLPSAYGANHPLHKLPEDNGATCEKWAAHQ